MGKGKSSMVNDKWISISIISVDRGNGIDTSNES